MTNHLKFKLSTGVEKNPGATQNNTDSHETSDCLFRSVSHQLYGIILNIDRTLRVL